ncbi:MAG: DUF2330 domain-containing protein [Candidatus Aenigmatarchaeota archaeon]
MWLPIGQDEQVSVITYENGKESMIISIEAELESGEIAWIFPIPSKPEQTNIDIVKEFPEFSGYEVKSKVGYEFNRGYPAFYLSQVYPIFLTLFSGYSMGAAGGGLIDGALQDIAVEIHEHIEYGGLTTELVTTKDETELYAYMQQKNLDLPPESLSIIEEYVGKDYSFIVSWISDGLAYRDATGGNVLGVKATFPTNDIFYPLRLTSIYDETKIPMTIYVSGHVSPNVFSEIDDYTDVKYYGGDKDYTKININSESRFFVDDLWMSRSVPIDILIADIILISPTAFLVFVFVTVSILSSIIAGLIIYKDEFSLKKFALLGLSNLLSIVGFSIASILAFKSERKGDLKLILLSFGLSVALLVSAFMLSNALLLIVSIIAFAVSFIVMISVLGSKAVSLFILIFSILFLTISFLVSSLILSAYPHTTVMSGVMSFEYGRHYGCMQYLRNNCLDSDEILLQIDANQNGRMDSGDTLQALAEIYYGCDPGVEECVRQLCGCNV